MALTFDEIHALADILTAVGLYPRHREMLLDEAHPDLFGRLPDQGGPVDLAMADLHALGKPGAGAPPGSLHRLLHAAVVLRGKDSRMDKVRLIVDRLAPPAVEPVEVPAPRLLRPDLDSVQYARLHRVARTATDDLATLADQLDLKTVHARITHLRAALNEAPYRVTITGKSRAGKSTLLNRLIGRPMCPSQDELTTAVPIVIGPAEKESIEVNFIDGRVRSYDAPIDPLMLRPYADQALNPGNRRRVEYIDVRLAGSVLDLGVEYVDIPGIDDPTEAVWKQADERVAKSHALVIVIDVAPQLFNGFTIDRHLGELVTRACQRAAPVFIACNKADVLNAEQRRKAHDYVMRQLSTLGLRSQYLRGPFMLSARIGDTEAATDQALANEYRRFDDALWHHLWHEHDIGIRRLQAVLGNIRLASEEVATLFSIRDKSGDERRRLKNALQRCGADRDAVLSDVKALSASVCEGLEGVKIDARNRLADWLDEQFEASEETEDEEEFAKALDDEIGREARAIATVVAAQVDAELPVLAARADAALSRLRAEIGFSDAVRSVATRFEVLDALGPSPDVLADEGWDRMLGQGLTFGVSTLIGLIATPHLHLALLGGALATAALTWVTDRLAEPETPARRRTRFLERLDRHLDETVERISAQLGRHEKKVCRHVRDHMAPYLRDVRHILLGMEPPTPEERAMHRRVLDVIAEPLTELGRMLASLHTEPADPSSGSSSAV